MYLAKTTSLFNNFRIRIGTAALLRHVKPLPPLPITTSNYKEALIIGIRASSSSVSHHPKEDGDPKLVDNMRQGVFRFQTSEEEEENTRNQEQDAKDEREMRSSNSMGDMATQGTVKAMEAGVNMGDKAKETADNIWNAARDTTHKIKEAVAGDGDDEKDKRGYGYNTDTGVEDLRNKAGGYDRPNPPSMASRKIGNSVKQ